MTTLGELEKEMEDHDLLIEIATQVRAISKQIDTLATQREVNQIKIDAVTQDQFRPVKAVTYGLVSLLLTSVCIAILSLVIKS